MDWLVPSVPQPLRDWVEAGVALSISTAAAVVLRTLVSLLFSRSIADKVPFAIAAKRPVSAVVSGGVLLAGTDIAIRQFETVHPATVSAVERTLTVLWIALLTFAVLQFTKVRLELAQHGAKDTAQVDRIALAQKLVSGFALGFGVLLAMRASGLDVTPLLAGGAVGGVIIGLALQESLSNVFSGLMINLDSSVSVGYACRMPSGEEGTIETVGWRTTGIRQWDGSLLVVPNSQLSRQVLLNLTREDRTYVLEVQGRVPFGSDLTYSERLLSEAARRVQSDFDGPDGLKPPVVRWRDMVAGHVVFKVYAEIGDAHDQFRARSALMKAVYETMAESGILIATSGPTNSATPPPE